MRKYRICALFVALCALILLCACEKVEDMQTLPELSKPYAGEYLCKEFTLGGEECLDEFDYIRLDLGHDGKFTLSYRDLDGREGDYSGEYSVSPEGSEIILSSKAGLRTASRAFPMENGKIYIELNVRGKLLHAVFALP